jgi:hypothetical protein
MKYSTILLACMMTVCINAEASKEKAVGMDELQWQYRVILVFAREPHMSKAIANLEEVAPEIAERDVAWFVLGVDQLHTNYNENLSDEMREQIVDSYFSPLPTETVVLLIGKDGTLKSRSSDLDLEAMFGLIDQMPMRRAEMRQKNEVD